MSLFNFDTGEFLAFFSVLVRFSTMLAVLPFFGDRMIPTTIKVLISLCLTVMLFPVLIRTGQVSPAQAEIWGSSSFGIITTVVLEAVFGLVIGFVSRMIFFIIEFAGNLIGQLMGFAAASMYDPHQESQTQVVAQLHTVIAMLVFIGVDGHYEMLRAALGSYAIVGVGAVGFRAVFGERLIAVTGEVLSVGFRLSAPMAITTFGINVAIGVIAKSMPQLNVLVLSLGLSALAGLCVLLLTFSDFQMIASGFFQEIGESMALMMRAAKGG